MTTSIKDLPKEVMEQILSRCGVKSVLRCESVCKSWESIISDTHFPRIHRLQRSKMWENEKVYIMLGKFMDDEAGDDDRVYFMKLRYRMFSVEPESYDDLPSTYVVPTSYCNGLFILRANPDDGNYMLLNPSIRKHTMIHGPTTDAVQDQKILYHLYYDSEADDYKFVLFVKNSNKQPYYYYYTVYSCKDCSWGERKDLPNSFHENGAIVIDGCVYYYNSYLTEIECLDSRDGKLDKIRVPEDVEEGDEIKYVMDDSGRLCVCSSSSTRNYCQVWVMEKKHCWRKLRKGGKWIMQFSSFSGIRLSNDIEDDGVIIWNRRRSRGERYVAMQHGFILMNCGKGFHKVNFIWSCSTPIHRHFENLYLPSTTTSL